MNNLETTRNVAVGLVTPAAADDFYALQLGDDTDLTAYKFNGKTPDTAQILANVGGYLDKARAKLSFYIAPEVIEEFPDVWQIVTDFKLRFGNQVEWVEL